jgi:hypothetical protein
MLEPESRILDFSSKRFQECWNQRAEFLISVPKDFKNAGTKEQKS